MVEQHMEPVPVHFRIQLERERHERWLDWVAVGVLGILTALSIWIIFTMMSATISGNTPQGLAEAGAWSKTFLTTLGGVAIGVLGGGRFRRGGRSPAAAVRGDQVN